MPSPHHYYYSHSHHVVVAAVLWLLCAAATGVGPPPPSSVVDDSGCLRRCGDVDIPYPFGIGPTDNCSVSSELRLHCNDTAGNAGVHKLFVKDQNGIDNFEVIDIDVVHGQMRVVSEISYSCFNNDDNTTRQGRSKQTGLPEPYRYSSASNKFTVLGCLAVTYMLGDAFENHGDNGDMRWYVAAGCVADCSGNCSNENSLIKHPTTTNGSCQGTIQGDEELRYYYATFQNLVNTTNFSTTYPCAYAVLMDSSYRFNFSTSHLLDPNNEFNKSRVPVVLDWVIRNKTCRDAHTQPAGGAGYACLSDHSECIDASAGRHGYICQCAEGFHGNPYAKDPEHGCKGISAGVLVAVIVFLAIKVLLHKRRMKRQALFQHNGGQLLKHMLKVEGNASFTVYNRGDIMIASRNFHKTKIVGEGAHGTVYKVTLDVSGRATAVAVKRCKAIDESRKKEFVQELVILCHLS